MGEARRRRLFLQRQSCWCGSGRLAGECCRRGNDWFKAPATLDLRGPVTGQSSEKCYMREFAACAGTISGEHLISESIIHLIAGDGQFSIGGTLWLAEGETKIVGAKSLTANCLCQRHNGRLGPLDEAALFFFSRIKFNLEDITQSTTPNSLVSGHDLERWLLKTVKAMAVSGNLGHARQRLTGEFADGIDVLDMLEDPTKWPPGTGLYCMMKVNDLTLNHNRFQIAPITNAANEICGLWTNIFGIGFVLVLETDMLRQQPELSSAVFRPGAFRVIHPQTSRDFILSWDDGNPHPAVITLQYLKTMQ